MAETIASLYVLSANFSRTQHDRKFLLFSILQTLSLICSKCIVNFTPSPNHSLQPHRQHTQLSDPPRIRRLTHHAPFSPIHHLHNSNRHLSRPNDRPKEIPQSLSQLHIVKQLRIHLSRRY